MSELTVSAAKARQEAGRPLLMRAFAPDIVNSDTRNHNNFQNNGSIAKGSIRSPTEQVMHELSGASSDSWGEQNKHVYMFCAFSRLSTLKNLRKVDPKSHHLQAKVG